MVDRIVGSAARSHGSVRNDWLKMKARLYRLGLVTALTFSAYGCNGPTEPEAPAQVQVSVTTLAPTALTVTEDYPGRVLPLREAEIRPQVSGIVLRRHFQQGSEVTAGQPLFQVNPAPFKAELDNAVATLQRARATFHRASVQAARLQSLVDSGAVSRQACDDAQLLKEQASADVEQAQANLARRRLDLNFATVTAPISGRIDQAIVTEGALVNASDTNPMAKIQQIDSVYVDVRKPASSLEVTAQAAELPVKVLRPNGEPHAGTGRMLFSGVNVDPATGDIMLRILVDNPRHALLPGMYVRARLVRATYPKALMIPQQAVVRRGSESYLWLLDLAHRPRLRKIELGEMSEGRYRVNQGVQAGDRVVVEGMERLTEKAIVTPFEWKSTTPPASPADA